MSESFSMYEKYLKLSKTLKDKILVMRVGEFYEIFGENAEIISKKLAITLTSKGIKNGEKIPMCGFPAKSKNLYFRKLLDLNYKIAITNIKNISENNKLKAKELIRFLTPGTVMEEDFFEDYSSRFITFVHPNYQEKKCYIASADITIGSIEIYSLDLNFHRINSLLYSIDPKEIIIKDKNDLDKFDKSLFEKISISEEVEEKDKFEKISLIASLSDNLFFEHQKFNSEEINAIFNLLEYIKSIHGNQSILMKKIESINLNEYCEISQSSFYGLEIFKDFLGNSKNTLFNFLNQTKTPMGARILKRYITKPETSIYILEKRFETVEFLTKNYNQLLIIQENLSQIGELERSIIRFCNNINSKNEVVKIRFGFNAILDLLKIISNKDTTEIISKSIQKLKLIKDLVQNFNNTFLENNLDYGSDFKLKLIVNPDQNIILKTFLVHFKNLEDELKNYEIEFQHKNKIKIKTSFDSIRGIYFIINPKDIEKIDSDFEKISISKDKIRIKTEKLKTLNEKFEILIKKIHEVEEKIIKEQILELKTKISEILEAIESISILDCLSAFGKISIQNQFSRPILHEKSKNVFKIKNGYHPLLTLGNKNIIKNDTEINFENKTIIITGPNMGGKSTFVKQNGIISIMSQIGCFVPAESAEISIVDKIFTRIGAVDILREGKSTFYMEMVDMKNIIENATEHSLCLLDEICIGTSQREGYSILFEILKYINEKIKSKVILATHYHEIQNDIENIKNASHLAISSSFDGDKIIFDYKLQNIKTDNSYPINVLKMLDFPEKIQKNLQKI